jgi:hypothetical protein
METIFIPSENEFRRWIKEAISEYFEEKKVGGKSGDHSDEPLLTRKEIAKKLRISLVTLTDWVKHGLPSHKQRGRVYFLYSEVIEYIKTAKLGPFRLSSKFEGELSVK